MRRLAVVLLILPLAIGLGAGAADAAKKKSKLGSKKSFQVGADLGAYVFSYTPFGNATFLEEDASFSASGGFGPIFGAHAKLFAGGGLIIYVDMAYSYQSGTAEIEFDNEDLPNPSQEFDYGLEMFRGSVGFGKSIMATSVVMPYWLLGAGLHHLAFQEEDEDEAATGTGLGPFGVIGVDARITKYRGTAFYAGGQLRLDIIYSVTPLERDQAEITMLYAPIALILSAGAEF
ncbi:hypothetical protein K8I61_15690 [bacterium]|nr:hypothetical protein [bacterium]